MKLTLLFFLSFVYITQVNAQCDIPPPPGCNIFYTLDLDNDGYTTFDVAYYIINIERPMMESIHNASSSGYNFNFYNSNDQISNITYTNIQIGEFCSIRYQYMGTGPIFQPQPPCNFPVPVSGCVNLIAVPFNGDNDGDGILNIDEDSNDNLNLMDDDDDNDGIINLEDTTNMMLLNSFDKIKLVVYPNPVENNIIYFDSEATIFEVIVYDLSGNELIKSVSNLNSLKLDNLKFGMYLVKFKSENGFTFKKIVIK